MAQDAVEVVLPTERVNAPGAMMAACLFQVDAILGFFRSRKISSAFAERWGPVDEPPHCLTGSHGRVAGTRSSGVGARQKLRHGELASE